MTRGVTQVMATNRTYILCVKSMGHDLVE